MVFYSALRANINLLRLTSPNRTQIKIEIECAVVPLGLVSPGRQLMGADGRHPIFSWKKY